MPRQLTVRGVPDEVAERIAQLSRERGQSINSILVEILKRAVGVDEKRSRLERYATWTEEDLEEFNRALSAQRIIDEDLWR